MMCYHGERRGTNCRFSPMFSVVLLVLLVVIATGQVLKNDQLCLAEGGLCAVISSCPLEHTINKTGLCPEQESCCTTVPDNVEDCHLHGGRCGIEDDCQNVQEFGQLNCPEGTRCCLLIY